MSDGLQNVPEISLYVRAAHIEQLLDGRFFLNSVPIAMIIVGAKGKSGHYLSFALRFCSFRLYPPKKMVPVSEICCNFYDSNLATLLTWPFFWRFGPNLDQKVGAVHTILVALTHTIYRVVQSVLMLRRRVVVPWRPSTAHSMATLDRFVPRKVHCTF
jgi:hypothetical protein